MVDIAKDSWYEFIGWKRRNSQAKTKFLASAEAVQPCQISPQPNRYWVGLWVGDRSAQAKTSLGDSQARPFYPTDDPVWPENSIYLKQREIIPGVVDNETTRCHSAWTRSVSC